MKPSYDEFKRALEYLVSIEPDPAEVGDEEAYDRYMEPFEPQIEKAHATIRAYGEQIAPQGLAHMQSVLYGLLNEQTDPMAESVIRSKVNWLWDGCGEWLG